MVKVKELHMYNWIVKNHLIKL